MLENEAHHDPLNFSEERCTTEEKSRFVQTFYTVVCWSRSDKLRRSIIDMLDRQVAFYASIVLQMICFWTRPSRRQTGKRRAQPFKIS